MSNFPDEATLKFARQVSRDQARLTRLALDLQSYQAQQVRAVFDQALAASRTMDHVRHGVLQMYAGTAAYQQLVQRCSTQLVMSTQPQTLETFRRSVQAVYARSAEYQRLRASLDSLVAGSVGAALSSAVASGTAAEPDMGEVIDSIAPLVEQAGLQVGLEVVDSDLAPELSSDDTTMLEQLTEAQSIAVAWLWATYTIGSYLVAEWLYRQTAPVRAAWERNGQAYMTTVLAGVTVLILGKCLNLQ